MYSVYILYSYSTHQFYKGHTNDMECRLNRHNSGFEKFTSKGRPWILIWAITKPTKSEAYQLELKLKNLSVKRLIDFILKYHEGIKNDKFEVIIKKFKD